jgi:isopenicillin N synthase-like dioxygenase
MSQTLLDAPPLGASRIPVLDVAATLAGEPGALEGAAAELRFVLENVGFFYLAGHARWSL